MTRDIRQLLDMARLRCEIAARAVARAVATVARADHAVAEAIIRAETIHHAADAERAAARAAFLGAAQSRVAVEDLLAGLSGLRDREAAADRAVDAARTDAATARTALAAARTDEARQRLIEEKRTDAARPLIRADARRAELRAEAEAAENWRGPAAP